MARKKLYVDRIKERTKVLGPGTRVVIWFHGCPRKCPGCVALEMNESTDYDSLTSDELTCRVLAIPDVEGVTISGGEPFAQDVEAMDSFLSAVRDADLSVMAYTGYLREELESDAGKRALLRYVDILVDGPYVESEDHGELWRGSANQRIHCLTDRYARLAEAVEGKKGRPLEFEFGEGLNFSFTGIPPAGFRDRLAERFGQKGLEVKW